MITTIIYDLDGTLINSIADLADATNYALRINGFPIHDIAKYNYFVGNGAFELIRRALPEDFKNNQQMIEKVLTDFSSAYNNNWMNKSLPYNGITDILHRFKDERYNQAVASNKPDFFVHKITDYFFNGIFDISHGSMPDINKKPAPDIVFKIIKELNVSKENCVFIGDSAVDIETAKNAGIFSIGCEWGFRGRDELTKANADLIVSEPIEIFQYIKTNERGL